MSSTAVHQDHSSKQNFPLQSFAAAFAISLLSSIFGGWQLWQFHHRLEEMSRKHIELTEDVGRIMLLDEVLTMSARMAAATGEIAYEKRYDLFDPQLTTEINKVRGVLSQMEVAQFAEETDEANTALVKMERQSFAWVHQNRRQEAMALLTSNEYMRLKKVYAGGMEKTVYAANDLIESEFRQFHSQFFWLVAASVLSVLVLLAVWFFAARAARSWSAERRESWDELRNAHNELEDRVAQRTTELTSTNTKLQHEISERTLIEEKNHRLTRFYAALSQCNEAIVHCTREEELFPQICRIAVQSGGIKMAWVGLVDQASRQIVPFASYGDEQAYLEGIQISTDADDPIGLGPTGICIRENQPFWCNDFLHDPTTAPWHERGVRYGWGSSASLPLQRDSMVIGAFTLYAEEVNAFDEAARKLLVEMATDINFALDNFAREAHSKQGEYALSQSESRYRMLVENAPYCIHEIDKQGRIISINRAGLNMMGAKAEAEVCGKLYLVVRSNNSITD